jgi:hypothetical protein
MKKFLLLNLLFIFHFPGKAQTFTAGTMYPQYTDIVPDKLVGYQVTPYTHNVYDLDIFGDSTNDLEFIAHGAVSSGGSSAYLAVQPLDPNLSITFGRLDSVFVPASSTWYVTKIAKPLNAGDAINGSSVIWEDTLLYMTDHSGSGGGNKNVNDFVGGDKYIGLWYQNGSSSWYGWIRVNCFSEDSCYVKDFSYSVASVGVTEIKAQDLVIYPNPVNDILYVDGLDANALETARFRLSNIYGQDVEFSSRIVGNRLGIDMQDAAPGCYLLSYTSGKTIISQKIIKLK